MGARVPGFIAFGVQRLRGLNFLSPRFYGCIYLFLHIQITILRSLSAEIRSVLLSLLLFGRKKEFTFWKGQLSTPLSISHRRGNSSSSHSTSSSSYKHNFYSLKMPSADIAHEFNSIEDTIAAFSKLHTSQSRNHQNPHPTNSSSLQRMATLSWYSTISPAKMKAT